MSSTSKSLRSLTAVERAAYDRDGYVLVPDIFVQEELELMDEELDRLLTQPDVEAAGEARQGWIYDVRRHSELASSFAEDERLLALIEGIVTPGIAIHSSKLVTKMPHASDICHWHQDEAFYLDPEDSRTASQTRMTVWVPLRDADERNGCLWVVPGSHRLGLEDYTWQETGTCQKRIDRWAYADEHAVPLPARAGSVVLFTGWTWHHSKNNVTDGIRRAFIISYQEASVPTGAGEQWKVLRPAQ